jgi:hypothetical protein
VNSQTNVNRILHSSHIKNGDPPVEPEYFAGVYRGFKLHCLSSEFSRFAREIDCYWQQCYAERRPRGPMDDAPKPARVERPMNLVTPRPARSTASPIETGPSSGLPRLVSNSDRPVLSLGRKPLALEAYRHRIGLGPIGKSQPWPKGAENVPDRLRNDGVQIAATAAVKSFVAPPPSLPLSKKVRRRPPASVLPWPPRSEWFSAFTIAGEPVPAERIRPRKDRAAQSLQARWWARRVAWEAALLFPEAEREAVELFVLRHRLSILAAFHRRLARVDVVRALVELF